MRTTTMHQPNWVNCGVTAAILFFGLSSTLSAAGVFGQWRFSEETTNSLRPGWTNSEEIIAPEIGNGILRATPSLGPDTSLGVNQAVNSSLIAPDDGTYALQSFMREFRGGNQLVLEFSTLGKEDITFQLDTTGSNNRAWAVRISPDGVNYSPPTNGPGSFVPNLTNWGRATFDLTGDPAIENLPVAYISIGAGSSSSTNFVSFDNLTLIAGNIPEPSTVVLMTAGIVAVVFLSRRVS